MQHSLGSAHVQPILPGHAVQAKSGASFCSLSQIGWLACSLRPCLPAVRLLERCTLHLHLRGLIHGPGIRANAQVVSTTADQYAWNSHYQASKSWVSWVPKAVRLSMKCACSPEWLYLRVHLNLMYNECHTSLASQFRHKLTNIAVSTDSMHTTLKFECMLTF